jgi:hypothetical protein
MFHDPLHRWRCADDLALARGNLQMQFVRATSEQVWSLHTWRTRHRARQLKARAIPQRIARAFHLSRLCARARQLKGGAVYAAGEKGQFAEELAELHDGSVSLFVTLPVFRGLLVSEQRAEILSRFESLIGEHLAHLDGILGDVLIRRERSDGHLTRSLFRSISTVRSGAATPTRDDQILGIIEQAQLFLMGSCSFALRYARRVGGERSVQVLEDSLTRIGSIAVQLTAPRWDAQPAQREWSDAVA